MKYLKLWTNFAEVIEKLDYDEIGSLFLAMLRYAETGEEPENFIGKEEIIWPTARRDINMATDGRSETSRDNGKKGGRPSNNLNNLTEETENLNNLKKLTEPNITQKEKKRKERKRNEISSSLLGDEDADEIQHEHDQVLDAAENAGFPRTEAIRAKLLNLYAEHGLRKMLDGINACVDYGVTTIAYLTAVLKGEPKKTRAGKTVSAQQYSQRDYSDEDDEAYKRMIEANKVEDEKGINSA